MKISFIVLSLVIIFHSCGTTTKQLSIDQIPTDKNISISTSPDHNPNESLSLNIPLKFILTNNSTEVYFIKNYKIFFENKNDTWKHKIFNRNKEFNLDGEQVAPKSKNTYNIILSYIISKDLADKLSLKNKEDLSGLKKTTDTIYLSSYKFFSQGEIMNEIKKDSDSLGFLVRTKDAKKYDYVSKIINW